MWADGALLQPLPMRTTATSGQVSATTAAILCATTIAPPPGTWSASQASSAPPRSCPAPQQLVVPRLRHRDGDAGRLKFGFPRSFFVVVTPRQDFLGVVKTL